MKKIGVLGGGSWGTTLANVLADNGHDVSVYMRDSKVKEEFNRTHSLEKYIKGVTFNENIKAYDRVEELKDIDIAVFAIPSQSVRSFLEENKEYFHQALIVNAAKGIEMKTGKRLSQVFQEYYKEENFVVLSGPTHAEEVVVRMPSVIVASSTNQAAMEEIQDLFYNKYFRVYTNPDVIGVEISGATKNIMALGVGILNGLGYGDNSKAAILTRGIHEIARLAVSLHANEKTVYGLTGIGDLIVTAGSKHSRNMTAGTLIGQGKTIEETEEEVGMVVEGIKTTKAVYELAEKLKIDMPITTEIYRLLYEGADISESYDRLMLREKKEEL